MIFINTRPLDEGAHYDRRPSRAASHHSIHSHVAVEPKRVRMSRIVLCLLIFYLLVSVIPVLLHYPISLVSLFVPGLTVLYALCHLKSECRSDYWPSCLIALIGIVIKTAAIIIYIIIFPFKDSENNSSLLPQRLQGRPDNSMDQYRMLFFIILVALEIFVLLVGICLKWHLVAFEKVEPTVHKRRATLTSNQPLISEARRPSRSSRASNSMA